MELLGCPVAACFGPRLSLHHSLQNRQQGAPCVGTFRRGHGQHHSKRGGSAAGSGARFISKMPCVAAPCWLLTATAHAAAPSRAGWGGAARAECPCGHCPSQHAIDLPLRRDLPCVDGEVAVADSTTGACSQCCYCWVGASVCLLSSGALPAGLGAPTRAWGPPNDGAPSGSPPAQGGT